MSDAEVARRGPRVLCQTRRSPDTDLVSFLKRGGRQTQTPHPLSNAKIVFQHRREPVSFVSRHQSEVRVQHKTHVFAVLSVMTGSITPTFSPFNEGLIPINGEI